MGIPVGAEVSASGWAEVSWPAGCMQPMLEGCVCGGGGGGVPSLPGACSSEARVGLSVALWCGPSTMMAVRHCSHLS